MLFYILYFNYIWTFVIISALAITAGIIYFIKKPRYVELEELKPSAKKDILIGLRDNAAYFSELLEPLFRLAKGKTGRKEWVFDAWKDAVESVEDYYDFKKAFKEKFMELFGVEYFDPKAKTKNMTKEEKKLFKRKKKILKNIRKATKKVQKAEKQKAKNNSKIDKFSYQAEHAKKEKQKKKLLKKAKKLQKKNVKIDKKLDKAANKLYVKYAKQLLKLVRTAGLTRNDISFVKADETTAETYDMIGDASFVSEAKYDVYIPFWSLIVRKREGLQELLENFRKENEAAPVEAPVVTAAPVENAESNEAVDGDAEEKTAVLTSDNFVTKVDVAAEATFASSETVAAETPVPATRKEKKKAKKAAKKEKKAAKKAAKKDKKLSKKIAKLEKKLAKAKKEKKKAKISKKIASCEKKFSKNKNLKKAIKALPISSTETLVAKGAVK